ncbi:MAG: multidrug effflux MFS transporter [Paracoccaceae bacterium]
MTSKPQVRFLDRSTPPSILTLIAITATSALAMNMFMPSLPSIAQYFDVQYRVIQLSVAVFLAMNAVLQLVIGPLSDRYGRRRVLMAGFVIFVLASLGCIFAPSAKVFLIFRAIQASVAVAMVLSRAIVRDMVPQNEAASMIGYITMFMAVVPMISPAIGGYLDQVFGWQATFWVSVGAGILGLWLIWADLGETNTSQSTSFAQQFSEYPALLSSPRFWGYSLSSAFAWGAFFAYVGGAPFVGTVVFGLEPASLGIYFGAPALGYIVGNFLSGRFSARLGANRMVLSGSLVLMAGASLSLVLFYAGLGNVTTFFGLMTFVGLGNGMVLPNATAGMLSVRPKLAGTASGLGGTITIGGGAGLSALAGALLGPGSGPFPLLWVMFTVSVLATASIIYVIRRDRALAAGIPAEQE